MAVDPWIIEQSERLRAARHPAEVRAIIELLEDRYDAFAGPGEELIDRLLEAARRQLVRLES